MLCLYVYIIAQRPIGILDANKVPPCIRLIVFKVEQAEHLPKLDPVRSEDEYVEREGGKRGKMALLRFSE